MGQGPQVPTYRNYIGGQWVESVSGRTYTINNPASKDTVLGVIQASVADDANRAIDAAHAALPAWTSMPAPQRAGILYRALEIMRERQDDLAWTITLEEGKPLPDSQGEVKRAMNITEYAAGEGRRLFGYTTPSELPNTIAYTTRRPLGVVGIISPWNFPIAIPAWKIAPALICGNTLVFKPASSTPLSAVKLVKVYEDAGLPPGVLNLITGPGALVGNTLVTHPKVKGISFTGSTEIGSGIYTEGAKGLKKVQCEMGGKNAVIVLFDADMEKTLGGIVQGAFGSTGQRCTATSRVIVEEAIYEPFIAELIARTGRLKVGDGMEQGVDVSPLSSQYQFDKVMEYIGIGAEEGARLAYGGRPITGPGYDQGYYIEPTIFTEVNPSMRIAGDFRAGVDGVQGQRPSRSHRPGQQRPVRVVLLHLYEGPHPGLPVRGPGRGGNRPRQRPYSWRRGAPALRRCEVLGSWRQGAGHRGGQLLQRGYNGVRRLRRRPGSGQVYLNSYM